MVRYDRVCGAKRKGRIAVSFSGERQVGEHQMANRLILPKNDNTSEALAQLRRANLIYRGLPWPRPFNSTTHRLHLGDARDLSWVADESVHLVVTSPPYWTLKAYTPHEKQLGQIESYDSFL